MVSKRKLQNQINKLQTNVSILKEEYVKNKMDKKMEELGLTYTFNYYIGFGNKYSLCKGYKNIDYFYSITEMYDYILNNEEFLKIIPNTKKTNKKKKTKSSAKK